MDSATFHQVVTGESSRNRVLAHDDKSTAETQPFFGELGTFRLRYFASQSVSPSLPNRGNGCNCNGTGWMMAQKLLIDCDPGIDDALALVLALFDPRFEVVAVTACSGTVEACQSTQNLQAIIERLDPPRHPRIGAGFDPEDAPISDGRWLHGEDGLGNLNWMPVSRQHLLNSDKLISDCLRTYAGQLSILCLGPLTGLARAFQRDPMLCGMVDRIVIAGGSLNGVGNVTATAEFNMHFDPLAAAAVFRSPTTKTLVPLEVASQIEFGIELLEQLPPKYTRVGGVLQPMLMHFFRSIRQHWGQETVPLLSAIALQYLSDPMLFATQDRYVEIEEKECSMRGTTFVDRRNFAPHRSNCEVVVHADWEAVRDAVYHAIRFAGACSDEVS